MLYGASLLQSIQFNADRLRYQEEDFEPYVWLLRLLHP